MKDKGIIYNKCRSFAVRAVALSNYLEEKGLNKIADQILRSAFSIGANYSESLGAESPQDFIHKNSIALKESYETQFWLDVIHESGYITDKLFESLFQDAEEIHKLLSSSILTMKQKINKV